MRLRIIALVGLSLVAAAGTAQLARTWLEAERDAMTPPAAAAAPAAPQAEVLVAAENLAAGTLVKDSHLRWQPWPETGLAESYKLKGRDERDSVVGAVLRRGIAAGAPVTEGGVVRPGDRGFLAAMLAPGRRAISVQVTAASGIAGLIFPGDRVDVILSHTFARGAEAGELPRRASETVLSDIRVLALDQRTDDQDGRPSLAKTATLEVTPRQAERLAVARELGQLSLSLRSLTAGNGGGAAAGAVRGPSYTLDSQVSALLDGGAADSGPTLEVVRGSEVEEVRFGDDGGAR